MARWRLAAPHYLNVEGTQWEYKEVDRSTGKQKRTMFDVPMHLDPDQPSDWTHIHGKDMGEIVVSDGNDADSKDIIFKGPPTPDMVPLDEDAKAVSAAQAHKWKHPIESLSGTYADEMLKDLSAEMDKVRANQSSDVKVEGMAELLTAMTGMMKQQQVLLTHLAGPAAQASAEPKAARRA